MLYFVILVFLHNGLISSTEQQQQIWRYAQALAGVSDLPQPGVEVKKLENVFGLADKERYVVYLDPQTLALPIAGFSEFVLTHEFTHLALLKKGMNENDHHCWMIVNHIQTKIAQWVIQNYLPYNRNPDHPLLRGAQGWEDEHYIRCIKFVKTKSPL